MFKIYKLKTKAKFSLLGVAYQVSLCFAFSTPWGISLSLYFMEHFGSMAFLRPAAVAKQSGVLFLGQKPEDAWKQIAIPF